MAIYLQIEESLVELWYQIEVLSGGEYRVDIIEKLQGKREKKERGN